MKRVGKLLFVSSLILSGVGILSSCSPPPPITYDDPSVQYVARSLYNAATANVVETERMYIPTAYEESAWSGRTPISHIEIIWSFYFTAEIEMPLEPYFPASDNRHYEFVFINMTFAFGDEHRPSYVPPPGVHVLIVRQGEIAYPFLTPDWGNNLLPQELPKNYEVYFDTHVFMSTNMLVVDHYSEHPVFRFNVRKEGENIALSVGEEIMEEGEFWDHEETSVIDGSYCVLPPEIAYNLLTDSFVEEGRCQAQVLEIIGIRELRVESVDLTNLGIVRFSYAYQDDNIINSVSVGDTIELSYYIISPSYNPPFIYSYRINII